MRVCMYVCMYLVCEVKVHACLWLQNVDVQFAVGGKVLYRPRTYHCVLVLRGREGRREGGREGEEGGEEGGRERAKDYIYKKKYKD